MHKIYVAMTYDYNTMQIYVSELMRNRETAEVEFKSAKGGFPRSFWETYSAFANLCVHADYSEESSLIVNRYPHKIVFSNPGVMLISKQQFYQGGESVCRNTSLQQMFMMIGSAEKAGSGVDKILKGWETLNWKRPYPTEKSQPNKVDLVMPLESLLEENVLAELDRVFGKRIKALDSNGLIVLSMALTEELINNERLRDTLALHPTDITHLLQRLCKEEFLTSSGYGRGTVYKLKVATSDGKVATSKIKVATSEDQAITPTGSKVITPMGSKVTTSGSKVTTSGTKVTTSIPSRISKEDIRQRIIEFCFDWRTPQEIADYLGRTKQYIRVKILPQMSDVLQMRFSKENHPGQKYKVKD